MKHAFGLCALFALAVISSCKPSLDDTTSRIDELQLIAVRADPAEAPEGQVVTLQALFAAPSGPVTSGPELDFCTARKPLSEPGAVSDACLGDDPSVHIELGVGVSVQGPMPSGACSLFGPDRPAGASPGDPAGRPADPDPTGGYYVPGRVRLTGASAALFEVRVRCGLAGASQAQVADFERRYHSNVNPDLQITFAHAGRVDPVSEAAEIPVAVGEVIDIGVAWSSCDTDDACNGAEHYVAYDPDSQVIVARREAMRVSWFATAGSFDNDHTGRDENDPANATDDGWTAPASPGVVTLWIVLRDSRGGVGFRTLRVRVG